MSDIGKTQLVGAFAEVSTRDSLTPSAVGASTRFVSVRTPSYSTEEPEAVPDTALAPANDQDTDSESEMVSVARSPWAEVPELTVGLGVAVGSSAWTADVVFQLRAAGTTEPVPPARSADCRTEPAVAVAGAKDTPREFAFSCQRASSPLATRVSMDFHAPVSSL
ncbi:hypothetical protein [Streptomyces sp. 900105755]